MLKNQELLAENLHIAEQNIKLNQVVKAFEAEVYIELS